MVTIRTQNYAPPLEIGLIRPFSVYPCLELYFTGHNILDLQECLKHLNPLDN